MSIISLGIYSSYISSGVEVIDMIMMDIVILIIIILIIMMDSG